MSTVTCDARSLSPDAACDNECGLAAGGCGGFTRDTFYCSLHCLANTTLVGLLHPPKGGAGDLEQLEQWQEEEEVVWRVVAGMERLSTESVVIVVLLVVTMVGLLMVLAAMYQARLVRTLCTHCTVLYCAVLYCTVLLLYPGHC